MHARLHGRGGRKCNLRFSGNMRWSEGCELGGWWVTEGVWGGCTPHHREGAMPRGGRYPLAMPLTTAARRGASLSGSPAACAQLGRCASGE